MPGATVLRAAGRSAHRIIAIGCLALLATVEGSCQSRKQLTETSARDLIREYISSQKQSFTVPVGAILPLMSRTKKDYTATASNEVEVAVKRLIGTKLVMQTPVMIAYPVISGQFSRRYTIDNDTARFSLDHKDHWYTETYTVETGPNSNVVTGKREITIDPPYGSRSNLVQQQSATGAVRPDGSVDLQTASIGHADYVLDVRFRFAYIEDGPTAYLQSPNGTKLVGKASGRKVELKEYEYSFSPEMQKRVLGQGQQAYVSGGSFEIGEVSGLRLLGETEATAAFAWHAAMNDLGRALLGDEAKPAGTGAATFAKKPDGTWFIDSVRY
ncbi:MAG: hypothetical protein ACLQVN_27150 [Bryobacteraceae bacterium]